MSNLSRFNTQIKNLNNDLINLYPEYEHLEDFQTKFDLLIKCNPRLSHKYFVETVYPYKDKILSKDADFFIKKDYEDDVSKIDMNNSWTLDRVLDMKKIWTTLSDDNKDIVWMYFKVLIKLSELC